jgi:hypothetical protein
MTLDYSFRKFWWTNGGRPASLWFLCGIPMPAQPIEAVGPVPIPHSQRGGWPAEQHRKKAMLPEALAPLLRGSALSLV